MSAGKTITFWNRVTSKEEVEKVYGDVFVQLAYRNPVGRFIADSLLSKRFISQLAGWYHSSRLSKNKINRFIHNFDILMQEYEEGPFNSFNDFFVRKFKPNVRTFVQEANQFPAFAEARYLGFEKIDPMQSFPVKGEDLRVETILGDTSTAQFFKNGPVLIARLCPVDYHRFHFPDDGVILSHKQIRGKFHSVNPLALSCKSDILCSNERHVSLLETKNFGRIAYVEVGAMCVGRIIQTHPWSKEFKRGDEKGYFLFGASTVIVFGEPGKWKPDLDILSNTQKKIETFVHMGDQVAHRVNT